MKTALTRCRNCQQLNFQHHFINEHVSSSIYCILDNNNVFYPSCKYIHTYMLWNIKNNNVSDIEVLASIWINDIIYITLRNKRGLLEREKSFLSEIQTMHILLGAKSGLYGG